MFVRFFFLLPFVWWIIYDISIELTALNHIIRANVCLGIFFLSVLWLILLSYVCAFAQHRKSLRVYVFHARHRNTRENVSNIYVATHLIICRWQLRKKKEEERKKKTCSMTRWSLSYKNINIFVHHKQWRQMDTEWTEEEKKELRSNS